MEKIYEYLPEEFVTFLLVAVFSLLIGLSQRHILLRHNSEKLAFGSDRTFAFIGISGYLLYIMDPDRLYAFIAGGMGLTALLAINYYLKASRHNIYGITTILTALITYSLAPIICTQPSWLYITVIVVVLMLTELKHTFTELAQRMKSDEFVTLAKFLAISGIILPMLPQGRIIDDINLTPYTVWLATVIVSGISYLSYILKRYVFRHSGILVSGIVGGLYSSTATISVLAHKCRTANAKDLPEYTAAMTMAVAMMNIRFLILILIFNSQLFYGIYPYLLASAAAAIGVALYLHRKWEKKTVTEEDKEEEDDESNPLEFKVAIIFAMLFVLFTVLTYYTLKYTGTGGLNVLSVVAGLSDITPFILNLLDTGISQDVILCCTMQAIASNIFVNMCYGYFFSGKRPEMKKLLLAGFSIIIALNIAIIILIRII